MKTWKLFSVLTLSMLLITMLAACGGESSGDTTQSGGQGSGGAPSMPNTDLTTSVPTTAAPTTTAPTTVAPTTAPSTGGCTTETSCRKAIITITPNQVKRGDKVTITGKGWVANAKVQASIGVQALDSDIISTTSDAQGNFSLTLTIDPQTPDTGPTNIHIRDTSGDSIGLLVQNQLTIIPSTYGCTTAASCQKALVTAYPNQVKPGDKVTITGYNWVANAKLQASIGVQALESDVGSTTSDAQGNFSLTLTIDPRTADIGPTNIHISLADNSDGSKNLNVSDQLTIIA